jgi:hypothetical protein
LPNLIALSGSGFLCVARRPCGNLFGVLLVLVPLVSFARDVEAPAPAGGWTMTDPPINFVHIEFGEINRRGEKPQPGGVGNAFSIAIAPDGAVPRRRDPGALHPWRVTCGDRDLDCRDRARPA